MSVVADTDISGQGEVNFGGGVRIQFALVHLTAVGPAARPLGTDPDHFMRIGFISFGSDSNAIDFPTSRTYWNPPIWLNFIDTQYHPIPTVTSSSLELLEWASRVRWSLSPGAAGHLHVEGI